MGTGYLIEARHSAHQAATRGEPARIAMYQIAINLTIVARSTIRWDSLLRLKRVTHGLLADTPGCAQTHLSCGIR